jgi:hypothetical protein
MSTQQFNIGPGISTADVAAIKSHIDAIMVILNPHLVSLTPEEIKKQRKLGKRSGYVDEMFKLATEQPGILPASFNLAQFNTVKQYISDLSVIEAHHTNYTEGLSDTYIYYGHIAMEIADRAYNLGKAEAKRGNTAVGKYVDRASRYFAGQGQKGHNANIEVGAGAAMTIEHVSAGSPFENMGAAPLSVQKTGSKGKALIVEPGEKIQLPDDYTSITISNQTPGTAGKFRIKLRAQTDAGAELAKILK